MINIIFLMFKNCINIYSSHSYYGFDMKKCLIFNHSENKRSNFKLSAIYFFTRLN